MVQFKKPKKHSKSDKNRLIKTIKEILKFETGPSNESQLWLRILPGMTLKHINSLWGLIKTGQKTMSNYNDKRGKNKQINDKAIWIINERLKDPQNRKTYEEIADEYAERFGKVIGSDSARKTFKRTWGKLIKRYMPDVFKKMLEELGNNRTK